jgi:hypothetical protein
VKQDPATIHKQLGQIEVLNGFLTPVIEDFNEVLSIYIKHAVGSFMNL